MMRRRCVCAATACLASPSRMQSSNSGNGNHSNRSHSRNQGDRAPREGAGNDSGVHTFIRDNRQSYGRPPRASGPRSAMPHSSTPAPAASAVNSLDWAGRLQQELMTEVDPMGGMANKDYYRDPARGYSPQYAPRDFLRGGELGYAHATSPLSYSQAAAQRGWLDHEVHQMGDAAHQQRATMRGLRNAEERAQYTQQQQPSSRFAGSVPQSHAKGALDQLHASGPRCNAKQRDQAVVDRYQVAGTSAGRPPLSYSDGVGLGAEEWRSAVHNISSAVEDDALEEQLRLAHGLRDKERFDFNIMQRSRRRNFEGYDMDRFAAQRAGTPQGAQQPPPAMPASTMEEAQRNLREAAGLPEAEAAARRSFAHNTVSDSPKVGEALTEDVVKGLQGSRTETEQQREKERRQRFGLGRQGSLVQDGGPDRRTLKKYTNDERLVDAMRFGQHAYRDTETDGHHDPYRRQNTQSGVGHLLRNSFDLKRRDDRVAAGKQDLTERSTQHYGVPVQQSVDEFVFRHRNARGERPLDYFKPFPDFRAQRLNQMYTDVEGFAMMKARPELLEWELFTRYRAHHQQRRELALLHGLEPVANETAQEREARRQALDELCERTPFDASRLRRNDDELSVDAETLRNWFGTYALPSPSIVESVVRTDGGAALNLHLQHVSDEMGTADTREHLLSRRYLNNLLLFEGYQHRIGRGFMGEVAGKAPEPVLRHAQTPDTLKNFTAEERAMYDDYVKQETERQLKEWEALLRGRRYVAKHGGQLGEVVQQGNRVAVVDVTDAETGAQMTISAAKYAKEIAAAQTSSSSGAAHKATLAVDGTLYVLVPQSERTVVPLTVKLESGEMVEMTDAEFSECPMEVNASSTYNHALNYGIGEYSYNRPNYIETQDTIWEESTTKGVEGWSPATHADGLRVGLPLRARRRLGAKSGEDSAVVGDFQRGRIVQYEKQPFFNPNPRLVTVEFDSDRVVQQVPLSDVLIWQRRYHGPERTTGDESRRYNASGLRRYVDVADPHNERAENAGHVDGQGEHFLDKYEVRSPDMTNSKYRTTKQITEIDSWNQFDNTRADNFRPLSISHRRDYIRQGYMHRYTPWEWIALQEADQPIIHETLREDNVGCSHFFSLNRYWRYKARPHGYLRNFEHEVRDLLQFVDGVTPWKQAQKIRTYWEVRQHHPMPQFNRPEVAMHRNSAALLPSHMWETDKKTGKVKGVKDSVRDYQTKTPLPKWVRM